MKKYKNLLAVILVVIVFVFSFVVVAEEDNNDFSLTDMTYDAKMVEEYVAEHTDRAIEFQSSLDRCKTLSYQTTIEEGKEQLDTITAETAGERDEKIREKKGEGYTTTVTPKQHDGVVTDFEFYLLNDSVINATSNGGTLGIFSGYYGRSSNEILNRSEFQDFENEEFIITNDINTNINDVNGSETFSRSLNAEMAALLLSVQGYTVSITQNNTQATVVSMRYNRRLNTLQSIEALVQALQQAAADNPNKEITSTSFSGPEEKTETNNFDTLDDANTYADELRASGNYASVSVDTEYDYDKKNATPVSTRNEGGWDESNTGDEYDEDVTTDEVITGYIHHYKNIDYQEREIEETFNQPGPEAERKCQEKIAQYSREGYNTDNLTCETNTVDPPAGPVGPGPVAPPAGPVGPGPAVPPAGPVGPGPDVPPAAEGYTLRGTIRLSTPIVKTYYDELAYRKFYSVSSRFFEYTFSYVPTDYNVNYSGTEGTISIRRTEIDKFYEIDAERPFFTISTIGNVVEDRLCLNPKTVDTGVKDNIIFEIMSMISACSLAILLESKIRKSN